MRIALAVLCAIALAAAAAFITFSEQSITARRIALGEFDTHARETADALGELRAAQQAYVAVGQGTSFWITKVTETTQSVASALAAMKRTAASAEAASALESASTALTQFGDADRRVRGYLKTGAQLMASDIVFTEGGEAAVSAARAVEKARLADRVSFDSFESLERIQELAAAGGVAALMLVTILGFIRKPTAVSLDEPAAKLVDETPRALARPSIEELPLRGEPWPGDQLRLRAPAAAPVEPFKNAAFFKAVAELCVDIGRVSDLEQLRALLGRTAQLLDASGLVLW